MTRTPAVEFVHLGMKFGSFAALEDINLVLEPHRFHVLLGENGAGKSTLVKCLIGYQKPTAGQLVVDGVEVEFTSPREAHKAGLGMVYQHFTLADNLNVVENFLLSRDDLGFVLDLDHEAEALRSWMKTMPFQLPLQVPVGALAAGEKQKLEILMQLYHKPSILVLDEPSSVLTPTEADEVLGLLKAKVQAKELTILLITHKFREFEAYGDTVAILRKGRLVGSGLAQEFTANRLASLMVGEEFKSLKTESPKSSSETQELAVEVRGLSVAGARGTLALHDLRLKVHQGEIFGVAGVSGNGQKELVEAFMGLHPEARSTIFLNKKPFRSQRNYLHRHGLAVLPELPQNNACVAGMSVWENLSVHAPSYHPKTLRLNAQILRERFGIKAANLDIPLRTLSGGNVQRTVLARELRTNTRILVVANPCFGLDFQASSEIRARIIEARNSGAAVLLISEDLDEVLELSDRIGVMSEGNIVWEATSSAVDIASLGRAMAGHRENHEA